MAKRDPTTIYGDFAFAWAITGITVIRARSAADARQKFDRMSRAQMLNQVRDASFMVKPIGPDKPTV